MKITVFNSRKEKLGENKEMSWEKFCDKVSHTKEQVKLWPSMILLKNKYKTI